MEELSPTARLPADVEAAAQDPSRRWGPYVLLGELGRGANGVVNLAYDLRLHRRVALKTLLEMSPVQFERFAREGRSAAKLEHPGIVRVLDLVLLNGRPCMAMEVVEGRSLRSCYREQTLRTRELVAVLRDVAEALGFAHAQGIVHRDVKPGNIFIDTTGRGRIMDFGVARDATSREDLTSTGATLGTPEYMSPEQASDPRKVSPQSDVYSLGAVLFEGLTGRPPFLGSTPVETMFKVMSENLVRPSALTEVPMVLEEVIVRCLDRDASKRFRDGTELARALDKFLAGRAAMAAKKDGASGSQSASGEADTGSSSARGLIAIGVAIGLVVSAGLGWAMWRRIQSEQEREKAALLAAKRLEEERHATDEAKRLAAEKKRRAEQAKADREAALQAALKVRDARQRIAKLDAVLAETPDDARALVARATARNDLNEDLRARNQPVFELQEATQKDVDAALAIDRQCAAAYIERARLANGRGDFDAQNAALSEAERTHVSPVAEVAAVFIELTRRPNVPVKTTEELVRKFPDYDYAWLLHAQALWRQNRLKEALAAYDKSLALHDRSQVQSERVQLFIALKDWDGVVAAADKWLESWPEATEPIYDRGISYVAKGDARRALEEAKKCLDAKAALLGHTLAAQAYALLADHDATIAESDALLALDPLPARDRALALCLKAGALERKGDLLAANDTLVQAAAATDVNIASMIVQEALTLSNRWVAERGDTEAAEQVLRRLCDTRARCGALFVQRLRVSLFAGDLGLARQFLGLAKQASAPNTRFDDEKLIEKCWREVQEKLKTIATASSRGDEAARVDRAIADAALGEKDRAKDEIERWARDAASPAVRARALLAHSRYVAANPDAAAEDIEKAVALVPEDGLPLAERAVLRARVRQEAGAREDAARALALSPKAPLVHARRAEACLVLGDLEGAAEGVRGALELDPECGDALSVKLHLDERRGDRAAQAADHRALAPLELYTLRADLRKYRAAYLDKPAPEKK